VERSSRARDALSRRNVTATRPQRRPSMLTPSTDHGGPEMNGKITTITMAALVAAAAYSTSRVTVAA
jgi:hypothetical protein